MTELKSILRLVVCASVVAFFCGCGTTPKSRFYQLQPKNPSALNLSPVPAGTRYSLTMKPTRIASYLERPQLVVKAEDGSMSVMELQRWAGNLEEDIHFVLVADVASEVIPKDIEVKPWPSSTANVQVGTEVYRFDCQLDGDCYLAARWTVSVNGEMSGNASKSYIKGFRKKTNVAGSYVGIVQTMNDLLYEWASDIVLSLPEKVQ